MKSFFLMLMVLASNGIVQAEPTAKPTPLTVAIFDFESKDEGLREAGPKVSAIINAQLSTQADILLVERAELEKVLSEQELGLAGNVASDQAAKVGSLTGAKVLVTGRVFKVERETYLTAKVIGTETGRVYGELVKGEASFGPLAEDLAKKIAAAIFHHTDTLLAKPEPQEDAISRLKKLVEKGAKSPVWLSIAERHYGRPVNDPAAQTELGVVLRQCGFALAENKSAVTNAIEISGEAFSAAGPQHGNLISCRARVEIQVRQGGQLLLVDRQTSVAVDITEQTAAKTALQNAAFQLAERMIPKLAK
jgi:hypothetical protein